MRTVRWEETLATASVTRPATAGGTAAMTSNLSALFNQVRLLGLDWAGSDGVLITPWWLKLE